MRVAVTGATGVIGRAVVAALRERGDEAVALSRDPERARSSLGVEAVAWNAKEEPAPVAGFDAVMHLAGEPVAQRWTDAAREEIRDSRVLGTRNVVEGMRAAGDSRPGVLVSQSASGYYGARGDEPVDESEGPGDDFLARVVVGWEAAASEAASLGVRVACCRTGVVLSESGGALEKMLTPFKLGVGGPVAGGRQHVPWVHIDDVVGALVFCLDHDEASGPVNVAAPSPATNRDLSRALGRALKRPSFMPVPGFAVKLLYGEMASIVTTGVRLQPARLRELGYEWKRPDLDEAVRAATGR